jgi:3',5'-cyclic AMP phosphodiesterase CpdA
MNNLRIAHISDLHFCKSEFYIFNKPSLKLWRPKRPVELYNALWECRNFSASRVKSLIDKVNDLDVDIVVATGDFTLTGKKREYRMAVEALKSLKALLVAVPGNHDVWSESSWQERRFKEYMGWACPGGDLPWLWDDPHGRARIIGLDSSKYSRSPTSATGVLSSESLDFLRKHGPTRPEGSKLVVALHHHVLLENTASPPALQRLYADRMRLKNAEQFWDAAHSAGVDLVLHGHHHDAYRSRHLGVAIHCVGSGGVSTDTAGKTARFDIVEVGPGDIIATTWVYSNGAWENNS